MVADKKQVKDVRCRVGHAADLSLWGSPSALPGGICLLECEDAFQRASYGECVLSWTLTIHDDGDEFSQSRRRETVGERERESGTI